MRAIIPGMLLMALLLGPGLGTASSQGITKEQADDILKELRGIRQALERLAVPPAGRPATAPAAPTEPPAVRIPAVTGYMLGRADAPLTIVEFTDLQCPFCKRFHDTTFDRLKTNYVDKGLLRFVTRDFPLDMHAQADLAARASRCAGQQDRFWDVRWKLLENASKLTPEFVNGIAEAAALDLPAFRACLDDAATKQAVQLDISEGRALGVQGTPTFIVGRTTGQALDGVRLVGAVPFETLDARLKALLTPETPRR